ncbi:MAG TPA: glycosyltransferase [Candidatus Omnitrophota bacterium]|nr:glycosyltransferase [Candidatus Omnitrophota bacterium]HRY85309.1 glycosyltransferase [Candidatus Omnitrophota bacterium]
MKVALVHDWLIHMRGGEKVLDALAELYPDATLYTLFVDRRKISPNLARLKIKTSFLQYLPGIRTYYRWLLPILPLAIRSLKIEDADLVISSSHCVAKGIGVPKNAYHICYCHTPMRYLWGFQDVYFSRYLMPVRVLINFFLRPLKAWDLESNKSVDLFIANSEYIKNRIKTVYQRDALVVHPPLETAFFKPSGPDENFYLAVSHFVPYKRLELVIEAFNKLARKLVVIGSGPLATQYQKLRTSDLISFWGSVSDEELRKAYGGAKALVFPTEEDFGIVPLEAQACGTPVIAFRRGGALETVQSGVFFDEQTPEAVREAVLRFESQHFERDEVSKKVQRFGRDRFLENMKNIVANNYLKQTKKT